MIWLFLPHLPAISSLITIRQLWQQRPLEICNSTHWKFHSRFPIHYETVQHVPQAHKTHRQKPHSEIFKLLLLLWTQNEYEFNFLFMKIVLIGLLKLNSKRIAAENLIFLIWLLCELCCKILGNNVDGEVMMDWENGEIVGEEMRDF